MNRVISDTKVPIKIWASDLELEAEQQVRNVANLPFIFKHVAVQADAHAGKGSTVGTVIATKGAIIPAAVGVDQSCGMAALKLPFKISDISDLAKLRHSIERSVPTGMYTNKNVNDQIKELFISFGPVSDIAKEKMRNGVLDKALNSLGTLGGGNHFIEVCQDQNNDAWIMLHSGSRNIGKCLAEIHIANARNEMAKYFIDLPDPDLAYLVQGSREFEQYIHDANWAEKFARANRQEMLDRVLREILWHTGKLADYNKIKQEAFIVNCSHNNTRLENHFGKNVYITRKGAISAKKDEWGIIPSAMGGVSHIVKGKGNVESFCSASHGCGRKMSRTKAKATFTVEDLIEQTQGVECLKTIDILDEIPSSYKNIVEVMANQEDLCESVYQLKALLCVKGT